MASDAPAPEGTFAQVVEAAIEAIAAGLAAALPVAVLAEAGVTCIDDIRRGPVLDGIPPEHLVQIVEASQGTASANQWDIAMAPPPPTPAPSSTPTTTVTSTGMAVDPDDKIPKTFAHWATEIDIYNNRLLDGKKRCFPENMLAGAESVLARVWHEHTKTKAYTPVSLGEILQKRLFTASGDVNPLTLPRQGSSAAAGQALRLVNGEVVSVEDLQCAPWSLTASTRPGGPSYSSRSARKRTLTHSPTGSSPRQPHQARPGEAAVVEGVVGHGLGNAGRQDV